ncbi:MAG TPA: hypothetical protein HPP90_01875 [Deltaproteobacteria bacterium]|nr:hypothetical protein [Deltaproteobacteria bacterium]
MTDSYPKTILKDTAFLENRAILPHIFLVFLLGLAVRIFVFQNTHIINSDGVLYIHQARALYYGNRDALVSCYLSYISVLPFFIAGTYTIVHDWLIAGKIVSLFFGFSTLFPIFFLLKRFVKEPFVLFGTLIFALIPVFIDKSADVLKDPVCWFFLAMGLAFFVQQMDGGKGRFLLILSCFFFLMASWARMEAILFIAISAGAILFSKQDNKFGRLAFFCMPLVLLALLLIPVLIQMDLPVRTILRSDRIADKLHGPFLAYAGLREELSQLINQPEPGIVDFFLQRARRLTWFIALGVILTSLVKALFYPFFFVFAAGFVGLKSRIKQDGRLCYLLVLCGATLAVLYLHTIETWIIPDRFFALFIIPGSVFLGFGMEKTAIYLQRRFKCSLNTALVILLMAVLAFALPKTLKSREEDKVVFQQIGEVISQREGNGAEIKIAAHADILRWISFYANLDYPGAPCPHPYSNFPSMVAHGYKKSLEFFKEKEIKYLLWTEKRWPGDGALFLKKAREGDFVKIGSWYHPDTGRIILLQRQ